MNDDLARIILAVGFALMFPIGIYFRLRSMSDEKLDRRQEGWIILCTLRPLGFAFMIGMVAFLVNPDWMVWASVPIPPWSRWIGVVIGVGTAFLLVWTFQSLGHNLTDTVVTRRNATLVTRGPYRWVRHPFYLAFVLGVIANSLVTANCFLLAVGTAAFLAIVARTTVEERKLMDRFGNDYVRYMSRTGRFFPRLGRSAAQ